MPPIRSIQQLFPGGSLDGVQIDAGDLGIVSFQTTNVPANQRTTVAKAETFINNQLATFTAGQFQAVVHVFSLSPLNITVFTADNGIVIPPNWWQGG